VVSIRAFMAITDTVTEVITFQKHVNLRSPRVMRSRRGATLIVTVLLGLVAASITLVIVRTALDDARVTASRRAYDLAYGSAQQLASEVARALNANPASLVLNVSENEPDRICHAVLTNGEPTVVSSGSPWPSACGTAWSYATTDSLSSVWVELPGLNASNLTIRAMSDVAGIRAGIEMQFRPGSAHPSLFSEAGFDISDLTGGTSTSTLQGLIYSRGSVNIPESGADFENAVIASESTITGANPSGITRYAGSSIGNGISPVRDIVSNPLVPGTLRGKHGALVTLACPNASHAVTEEGSNHLCLKAGVILVNNSSQSVQAPSNVASWLLLPSKSSENSLDVYFKTSVGDLAESCPSATPNCSLAGSAEESIGHPSRLDSWTLFGSFAFPSSGLIYTDTTTHLGLCGTGFATTSGVCTAYRTATPGLTLTSDLTIIVGTSSNPADLYITGPISSPTSDLGLAVSGDLILPYWARPVRGNLTIDADIMVLGRSIEAIIRTLPSQEVGSENLGGNLTMKGSFALTRTSLNVSLFENHRIETLHRRSSSPWWSLDNSWKLDRVRRLTSSELATPNQFR